MSFENKSDQLYDGLIDRMAAFRERNRLSVANMAELLDVSRSTIQKMLHGEPVTLSSSRWCRLMVLCGIEISKGGERHGNV